MRCHNPQQERREETELENGPVSVRWSIYISAADVSTVCVCVCVREREVKLG